jgi:hypothetical protein
LLLALPTLLPDFRERVATYVLALDALVLVTHAVWCIVAGRERVTLTARLAEVVTPYGLGLMVGSVLMVPIGEAREAARRTQCRGHFKQMLLALHNYHDTYFQFPDLASADGQPPRSWRVEVLPFIDQRELREKYDDGAAWDSAANRPVAVTPVSLYRCPSHPFHEAETDPKFSSYSGVRGPKTLFPEGHGLSISDVTDGTSNTIALVESCGRPILWTEPKDVDLSEQTIGVNLPGERPGQSRGVISSPHPHGGHIGLADGSVRWVSDRIDPKVLAALLTATGNDEGGDY